MAKSAEVTGRPLVAFGSGKSNRNFFTSWFSFVDSDSLSVLKPKLEKVAGGLVPSA